MPKKGLVLGGGGAKGAYQIGAWKAFDELGEDFDLVVGSSVGALNGALMAQGGFEWADGLWEGIEQHKVFSDERGADIRRISSPLDMLKFAVSDAILEGSFDSAPLEALLRGSIDEDRVRSSPVDFGLVTVEFPRMRPFTPMKKDIPPGRLHAYLMATAACFPVLAPYEIDGLRYLDGGYYDNLPINLAAQNGAERIVAVDLEGMGIIREPKHADLDLTIIRSYWDLGAVFDFDKNVFLRNRMLGYYDTLKAFGRLEGMHYAFYPGEQKGNYDRFEGRLWELISRIRHLVRSPAARGVGPAERRSAVSFLSGGRWGRDPGGMLCRVAEIAGTVFSLPPDRLYTFEEFNRLLLREYHKRERLFYQDDNPGNLTRILASVTQAADRRQIAAFITQMLLRAGSDTEPAHTLAWMLPREYAAAVYLKLLVMQEQAALGPKEP
jgi:NTE family protein